MENDTYAYKEEYFYDEDSYQHKRLLDYVNNFGYLGGIIPSIEANKKTFETSD